MIHDEFYPSVNDIYSRRCQLALRYFFKGNSEGLDYTAVLTDLVYDYMGFKKSRRDLYDQYDGFMVKSRADLSYSTGLSLRTVGAVYRGLVGFGLIELERKAERGSYCIKVNIPYVEQILNEEWDNYQSSNKERIEEVNNQRLQAKKHSLQAISFYELNLASKTNDYDEIKSIVVDEEATWLVYLFNHYYQQYCHKVYVWSRARLNTLMKAWRGKGFDSNSEYALSVAICEGINEYNLNYRRDTCPAPEKFIETAFNSHIDRVMPKYSEEEIYYDALREQKENK